MGLYEDNYEVTETQPTSESPGPADAEMGREVLFKDIMQGTSALGHSCRPTHVSGKKLGKVFSMDQ